LTRSLRGEPRTVQPCRVGPFCGLDRKQRCNLVQLPHELQKLQDLPISGARSRCHAGPTGDASRRAAT
jgi:hypothetical protein